MHIENERFSPLQFRQDDDDARDSGIEHVLLLAHSQCLKIIEKVSFLKPCERSEQRLHFEWTKIH